MRAALALALAGLAILPACKRQEAAEPFGETRPPPGLQARFYPPEGWAWGLAQVGDFPPARYGVSAPPLRPRADVLVLPGYGQPAETWFETAAALNARGHVVWVLEPIGQGGSGRYRGARDVGHAASLEPDTATLKAFARSFVRRRPLVVIAMGTAAPTAIDALNTGLEADSLVLVSPALDGARPVPYAGGWNREGPDDRALGLTHDEYRARLRTAWEISNPDLRMGAPARDWLTAYAAALKRLTGAAPIRVNIPVLITTPEGGKAGAEALCRRLARCAVEAFGAAGQALHLEADETRDPWLKRVIAFAEAGIVRLAPPPMGARVAPEGQIPTE